MTVKRRKPHTSFRLSPEAKIKLEKVARHMGLTRTAVLEWLIRAAHRSMESQKKGGRGGGIVVH